MFTDLEYLRKLKIHSQKKKKRETLSFEVESAKNHPKISSEVHENKKP